MSQFDGSVSSGTSFTFSWTAPSIAAHLTTAYSLTCIPLLAGIPSPQSLTIQPSVTSATVGGLYSGVGYNCSITTISGVGPSEPESVVLTTPEIGELYKKNLELHIWRQLACMQFQLLLLRCLQQKLVRGK